MTPLLDNFFNTTILAQYWPSILGGFWLTVEVALATIAIGVLTGLAPVSYTHLTLPTICSV